MLYTTWQIMAGYDFPSMLESEAQLANHDSSRVFEILGGESHWHCHSFDWPELAWWVWCAHRSPMRFEETNRGRPLEFNHQWILCRKNQTIPPLTPSSCNTTNSCSYNRRKASLDLGIFAQISKVMNLKIRMHFVWNTQQCFSKSPIPKFLVFGTKLWATTRLFGSVFPASTWMGLYLASSCPGNSGNCRVRQSSH